MAKLLMASGRIVEIPNSAKQDVIRKIKGRPLRADVQVDLQNGLTVFVRHIEGLMEDEESIKYVSGVNEPLKKKAGRPKTKETVIR